MANEDEMTREIRLLLSLLPPPISLDILCQTTGHPPVRVLQAVENLVRSGYLKHSRQKGAGYYRLTDTKTAHSHLAQLPETVVFRAAEKAIQGVSRHLPDNAQRWLSLAHIYQFSGLPLRHYNEIISAAQHCLRLNRSTEAAVYYTMAVEKMVQEELSPEEQVAFINAAIGLCTCRDTSLNMDFQRRFLKPALKFSSRAGRPEQTIQLRMLLARIHMKTGNNADAEKQFKIAWQMLSEHDVPSDVRIQVGVIHSEFFFWQGYITKALECYESVIDSSEALPSDIETLKSYARLGWTYGIAGETARGLGLIRGVRKKAKELGADDLERYATLVLVIVLTDAGRISEAEAFLKKVFDTPPEQLDPYTLWPGNGKRAYFAYLRGDYQNAYDYHDQAWQNSKALGSPHHRGADNLEVMLGLEERGMPHPEWHFEYDIQRLLKWPDIYMQGIAYRYLALKAFRKRTPGHQIKSDLEQSRRRLARAGARVELAHTQVLTARVCLLEKQNAKAESLLKAAWETFSSVNPELFPEDLKPYLDRTNKNALWVESLLKVSNALYSVKTKPELLSNMIRQAMRISGAERGAIFLSEKRELKMAVSRNLDPLEISGPGFSEQLKRIQQVFTSGQEIIRKSEITDLTDENHLETERWTACFPIRLKSRVLGILFMDSGLSRLRLPEDETALLRIISNQAAVALENMEAYEEMVDLNQELKAETLFYRKTIQAKPLNQNWVIGRSHAFKQVLSLISQVAPSDSTVMITGETGVGKDLVAQAIHQQSPRSAKPFIAVNLVSLSPELIASELFGHEKGAFTGATQTRKGRFELASNGTLFLDDIDAFSMDIQVKMLRVLETKEFERVGGTQTLNTSFRLIAASNRHIEELVEKGQFRSDFYYRLNVFPIHIPPLRERQEDIPELASHFMQLFSQKFNKKVSAISKKDLDLLMSYHWPGNIRELRHVMERAVLLSQNKRLVIPPLDTSPMSPVNNRDKILPFREMEARHITRALNRCGGKVSGKGGAAQLLQLKPTTLASKMKRLGIARDAYRYQHK